MSGPNFNILDRIPLTHNLTVVDVYSADDLPPAITAPDGISRRPLAALTRYTLHESFVWPRIFYPKFTQAGNFEVVDIVASNFSVNILVDGPNEPGGDGDTAHFWGREMSGIGFRDLNTVDVGNSGAGLSTVLFDLVGGAPLSNFIIDFSAIFNFKDIGSITAMPLFIPSFIFAGNEKGLVIRSLSSDTVHNVSGLQFIDFGTSNKTPQMSFQGPSDTASLLGGNVRIQSGDSAFHIDSAFTGVADILGISYGGVSNGNFFRPNISKSLTAMATAANIIISGVTDLTVAQNIDSVAAGISGSNFTTDVAHGFRLGDSVINSGFAVETSYNGTFTITRIVSTTVFEIAAITFTGTDTGLGTVQEVGLDILIGHGYIKGDRISVDGTANYEGFHIVKRVNDAQTQLIIAALFVSTQTGAVVNTIVTSVGHGFADRETITITGTTFYNGTFEARRPTDDTFQIAVDFISDDATGTVVSTGQDETSIGINVANCGAQKDSMIIGTLVVGGNATATVIVTQNVFVDLDLGSPGAVAAGNIERFTVTNATTGEIRYDGLNPITLNVDGVLAASSTGGGQRFNFQALKNGSVLPSPDDVDVPIEVGNNLTASALGWAIEMVTGDLFRIQVANAEGTSNITIDTLKITIT